MKGGFVGGGDGSWDALFESGHSKAPWSAAAGGSGEAPADPGRRAAPGWVGPGRASWPLAPSAVPNWPRLPGAAAWHGLPRSPQQR